jgi:hypothetical protein
MDDDYNKHTKTPWATVDSDWTLNATTVSQTPSSNWSVAPLRYCSLARPQSRLPTCAKSASGIHPFDNTKLNRLQFVTCLCSDCSPHSQALYVKERLQNCKKWLLASSCLSVRTSAWNNSAPAGWTFRHRVSCILGQAFHYSQEKAFYIFNQ